MRCPAPRSSPYTGREHHASSARTNRPPGSQFSHPPHPRCSPSPVPKFTQPSLSPCQPSQGRQFYIPPHAYPKALLRRGLRFAHPPVEASSSRAGGTELFREEPEEEQETALAPALVPSARGRAAAFPRAVTSARRGREQRGGRWFCGAGLDRGAQHRFIARKPARTLLGCSAEQRGGVGRSGGLQRSAPPSQGLFAALS